MKLSMAEKSSAWLVDEIYQVRRVKHRLNIKANDVLVWSIYIYDQTPASRYLYICALKKRNSFSPWLVVSRILRLSPATSSKFGSLKEYSLSFTALSKKFCSLYLLHLQQRPLNSILYIYNVNRIHKLQYLFYLLHIIWISLTVSI